MLFAGWDTPLSLLKSEIIQREYEGYIVPDEIKSKVQGLETDQDEANNELINSLFDTLENLSPDPAFTYEQPNDLDGIRLARPSGPRRLDALADNKLLDRFHGAWLGRASGCALGKPVEALGMVASSDSMSWSLEAMGMKGAQGMNGREAIKAYLQNRNDWPLTNYFSGQDVGDDIRLFCPASQRENIAYMEPDDDIHYTLIALHVMEQHGSDFTWKHVANAWNSCLPFNAICTAETQAILNYSVMTPRINRRGTFATPDFTSTHRNPYREWIGAQIRADGWGYACAGMPELAAQFAFRDACWTHRANGIYGEMFFAAVTAAAFVESDPLTLISIGLSEIPANCRLSEAVHKAIGWIKMCNNFEDYMLKVEAEYRGLSPVHTVNNALIVIGSMAYGEMEFDQTICTSVSGGLDTDCNGATSGSIAGAANGAASLTSNLIAPLNDTIKPLVFGFSEITMTELAQRTLVVHQAVRENA